MTLRERMERVRAQGPHREPREMATELLGAVRKADLFPLVEDEFRRLIRANVRGAETARVRSLPLPTREAVRIDDLKPLLDKAYRWRNGGSRELRHMTIAEHEERIQMLLAQRNGIARAIEVHQSAIELIQRHGVDTLADLENGRAAAA